MGWKKTGIRMLCVSALLMGLISLFAGCGSSSTPTGPVVVQCNQDTTSSNGGGPVTSRNNSPDIHCDKNHDNPVTNPTPTTPQ